MMLRRALVVCEPSAHGFALEIADSLESAGMRVAVHGLHAPPYRHDDADLVVVGAAAASFVSRNGEALRSWLMSRRASHVDQRAAAFDLRHGRVRWPQQTSAVHALRAMSAREFRLAARPISLGVTDELGTPAAGELSRARDWACGLGEAMADPQHFTRFLLASAQPG